MVYLDYASTSNVRPEIMDIAQKYLTDVFGNPSSLHRAGLDAENAVKKSTKLIARALGCKECELIFTSGGTEGNNLAILNAFFHHPNKAKHIITSAVEHHAVLAPCEHLANMGWKVSYMPVTADGTVDVDALLGAWDEDTALISLIFVNNETGAVNPIGEIAARLRAAGYTGLIHTDATQMIGKMSIDVKSFGVDLLTASGHKFNAPKGVGFLYVKEGTALHPMILGGGQQLGRRSGTLNVFGITSMALALESKRARQQQLLRHVYGLENHLIDGVKAIAPEVLVLSEGAKLPYITALAFPNIKSEVLLHSLEAKGIYVSSGSACGSHRRGKVSHVVEAMGVPETYRDGVIRVSIDAVETSIEDIDMLISALKEILPKLNKVMGE